jgi:hypothetical protein
MERVYVYIIVFVAGLAVGALIQLAIDVSNQDR